MTCRPAVCLGAEGGRGGRQRSEIRRVGVVAGVNVAANTVTLAEDVLGAGNRVVDNEAVATDSQCVASGNGTRAHGQSGRVLRPHP